MNEMRACEECAFTREVAFDSPIEACPKCGNRLASPHQERAAKAKVPLPSRLKADASASSKSQVSLPVIALAVLVFAAAYAYSTWRNEGGAPTAIGTSNLADIYGKVVDDSVAQYEIAKRQGSKVDVCVHAGLVAAAYLQAKDEPNYGKWKAVESQDCASP